MQSSIEFTIDDRLMEFLEQYGIDINPKDDQVRFELNCEADQGADVSFTETVSVELRIEKRYLDGELEAGSPIRTLNESTNDLILSTHKDERD